jgi:hypothetical protein
MLLQHLTTKQYALLPSGVLIVEPDPGLLAARVLLLSAADFYVGQWDPEPPRANELDTVVVVAVLSQTLGKHGLPTVAKNIRTRWPSASILILGDVALDLETALYDAVIDHRSRPEVLLIALALLARNRWAMSPAMHKRSEHITVLALESDAASYAGPSVKIRLRARESGSLEMPTKENIIESGSS